MRHLEEIRKNESFLKMYTDGMSLLIRSGIFNVLRDNAKVKPLQSKQGTLLHELAAEAKRSEGYTQALDELVYFREMFLFDKAEPVKAPSYGALTRAKETGDLEQEEIDAIRTGQPVRHLTGRTIPGKH